MDDYQFVSLASLASQKGKTSRKKQANLLKGGDFFPPPGHAAVCAKYDADTNEDEEFEDTKHFAKVFCTGGYRKGYPTTLDANLVETTLEVSEQDISIKSVKTCTVTGIVNFFFFIIIKICLLISIN